MCRFRNASFDQLLTAAHHRRPAGVLEPFKAHFNNR